ncbi:MAG: response regulator, partial [Leptolyngbyaceae bacterium]|nr:response regulator [Leptolyngbyaceae bacterium]
SVIAQLQEKFGDDFSLDNPIPSSADLGFDIVAAMFESGVAERLDTLEQVLTHAAATPQSSDALHQLKTTLINQATVFQGLAESVNLSGFRAIATLILEAIHHHPDQVLAIATVAFTDLSHAKQAVLEGDRTHGGNPSATLQQYATADAEFAPNLSAIARKLDDARDGNLDFGDFEEDDPIDISFTIDTEPDDIDSDIDSDSDDLADLHSDILGQIGMEDDGAFTSLINLVEAVPLDAVDAVDESLDELGDEYPFDMADSLSWDGGDGGELLADLTEGGEKLIHAPGEEKARSPATPPAQSVAPAKSSGTGHSSIRIDLAHIRRLEYLAGELLIKQNGQVDEQNQIYGLMQSTLSCLRQHVQTIHRLWDWSDHAFDLRSTTLRQADMGAVGLALSPWPLATLGPGMKPYAIGAGATLLSPQPHGDGLHGDDHLLSAATLQSSLVLEHPEQVDQLQAERLELDALELDRHDRLHELVQTALEETSLLESLLGQVNQFYKRSKRSTQGQKRLLAQTWDTLTNARMQSLQAVFQRLPRLIRQLTMTYGKDINLVLPDNDILVDRLLVDTLHDSLLHLLRNAFDHGIEMADIREQRGKSTTGNIQIRAFNQGQYTVIEVEDDGAGIDVQVVAQKAVEQGLTSAERLAQLSPAQILEFLFEPGFSTTSQVSDLSGRGVGLDVVRSQLGQINGTVIVKSVPGQGACFTLRLPLTLSIARQMLCQADGIVYAFPLEHIEQIILPTPDQVQTSLEGGMVLQGVQRNNNQPVRLYHLGKILQYSESRTWLFTGNQQNSSRFQQINAQIQSQRSPTLTSEAVTTEAVQANSWSVAHAAPASSSPSHSVAPVFLLRFDGECLGIVVDKVIEEQELVIRPLGSVITPPACLHGCAIFGVSQLALVLDPLTLMRQMMQKSGAIARESTLDSSSAALVPSSRAQSLLPASAPTKTLAPGPITILVVDDSPTVRQNLVRPLEEYGYRTQQAGNGRDALAYLRMSVRSAHPSHPIPTLVICDIEMPILDGFQFLMEHRSDPAISHIPVAMLTSRSGDKHRNIALGLGAQDYLTKPCQQKKLLATIETLIATH